MTDDRTPIAPSMSFADDGLQIPTIHTEDQLFLDMVTDLFEVIGNKNCLKVEIIIQ